MARQILFLLLLVAVASALTWDEFVRMPLDEKMILQYEQLGRVANGSFINPYLTRAEAASWRASYVENILEYSRVYPADYSRAVSNVRKAIATIKPVEIKYVEAKFVKVGDHYVSEGICKAFPQECVAPAAINQTKTPVKPANKRTAAECLSARQKDWDAFVYSNYPNVPSEGANEVEKQGLLDRMAEGYYSWQAQCLRGE